MPPIERAIAAGNLDALTRCLVDWNECDPNGFHAWLDRFRPSLESSQLVTAALARGGLHDTALEFALGMSESHRPVALETAFAIHSSTAPYDAWKLTDSIPGKETLRDIVLKSGSDSFLPQLADLALRHHESSGRVDGLRNILSRWTLQDPAEAAAWMNRHTLPAEIRDSIASHLVFQCDSENRSAETAIAWAKSISEDQLRIEAIHSAVRELANTDPADAVDTIQCCALLTDDEKRSLIEALAAPVAESAFPAED